MFSNVMSFMVSVSSSLHDGYQDVFSAGEDDVYDKTLVLV
jgi:hypothetical protein